MSDIADNSDSESPEVHFFYTREGTERGKASCDGYFYKRGYESDVRISYYCTNRIPPYGCKAGFAVLKEKNNAIEFFKDGHATKCEQDPIGVEVEQILVCLK